MTSSAEETNRVLWAGRALEDALFGRDDVEVAHAAQELVRVASAREAGVSSTQRFQEGPGHGPAQSTDDALKAVLADLNLSQTLLVAGRAVGESGVPEVDLTLGDALDELESDQRLMVSRSEQSVKRFSGREDDAGPPLEMFRARLQTTIDSIVGSTVVVGTDAFKGLLTLPANGVQPILAGALNIIDAIPHVGPLVALGLKAMRRAVGALERLVPEGLRDELKKLAAQLWGEERERLVERGARRLLEVESIEVLAAERLSDLVPEELLVGGARRLDEVLSLHSQQTAVISRITRLLSTVAVPLALSLAAAASWIYGAAAMGYLCAFGAAVWIGRDCLDTGALWERVPGVRTVLIQFSA